MRSSSPLRHHSAILMRAFLLILLLCAGVSAQEDTSSVRGTITDPQGNAVAGATVTLRNPSRNFTRTQTTNESGGYVFELIPPGAYQVEAEASGFKKATASGVQARVDTPVDLDVRLEVGDISETVQVSGATDAPINTSDATIGNTFESKRIENLPLNARNIVGLLSLQPGVSRLGESNGGRRDQGNLTLDGVDNNEQQTGLDIVAAVLNGPAVVAGLQDANSNNEAFAGVLRSTPDSVQEFRVVTSVPNASQGRSSGAQVSLVTKSGTNEFHGSLYWFHRNTVTTSNDYFNNAAGNFGAGDPEVLSGEKQLGDERIPRPKLIRNIFGGSLGGPLIKDRTFFFYNYEGRRDASEISALRIVPTATLRQGTVRYENTAGGVTTLTPADLAGLYPETGGVNPAGLAILQTAPLPNDFSIGDGLNTGGFRFNAPIATKLNTHIARFDFVLTDRQSLFVRGNYQQDLYGLAPQFPTTTAPGLWVHPYGFVAGHTWAISNTLVNNLRVGLTRQAFSQQGDSDQTLVNFRFVYQPFLYQRGLDRTTPVWNLNDDLSAIKGNHTVQLGTNLRWIRNNRSSTQNSFDAAIINPSFFDQSGAVLLEPIDDFTSFNSTRDAVAAVLGRLSQYTVNVVYDRDGQVQPAGTPSERSFATEEYDLYAQDSWKLRPNLTVSYGLRWGYNTPVYERNGLQVKPTVSLGEYFERRVAGAEAGRPVNDPITIDLAGKANDRPGFYEPDWNNFAPSVAVAWSPDFGDNWFGRLVGRDNKSVLRGGFRMIYDRVGSALAVGFDLNNTLGFSSGSTISANTFNVTTRTGPRLSGLGPDVRSLPEIEVPGPISFPLLKPSDERQRIENTLDDTITTPVQYTWNLTYGRELPKGISFDVSYVGRAGRNLLTARDVMHLNNLRDPQSGQTWYEAAGVLADLRAAGVSFDSPNFPRIPFFENLYPGTSLVTAMSEQYFGEDVSGFFPAGTTPSQMAYALTDPNFGNLTDWTFFQTVIDDYSPVIGRNAFFHPQYAALGVYSTVGSADYHGATLSVRHRFKNSFLFDFNYTLSKSLDTGSQFEGTVNTFTSQAVINPLTLKDARAVSDFDVRHNINANWLLDLPLGSGKKFLGDSHPFVNALLGGWQLSGIFRYNSGIPLGAPFDGALWATNWNAQSSSVRIRPVNTTHRDDAGGFPNVFGDALAAYRSFRNARAGESGDRNIIRLPSYFNLDAALSKSFKMPYSEGHELQLRWEVFNVTNTQRFGVVSTFSVDQDPDRSGGPADDFGRYVGSQLPVGETRPGRVMQFALRYRF